MKNAPQTVNYSHFTEWFAPRMTEMKQLKIHFFLFTISVLSLNFFNLLSKYRGVALVGDPAHTWDKPAQFWTILLLSGSYCLVWMCVAESTCVRSQFITGDFPNELPVEWLLYNDY